jgi:acyl-CoA synthetase (AMP-forming)/AMP-acid ligase II
VIVGDAFARPLVDALDDPQVERRDVTCLRVLLSGGAILSPTVKRELVEHLPGTLVVDGYGASETGGQGQAVVVAGSEISSAPRFKVSDDTAVLDDDLRPVAPGVVGRLARRGFIPFGYYKDPQKTAATFPVVDGVRWSVPGDHAVIDGDGWITLLGRGSVGERVVAVVQAREGQAPDLDELQAHARASLAGYKVPRELVVVDEIERSPSGKPDYRWARTAAAGDVGS